MSDDSRKSLVQILIDRADTGFNGYQISEDDKKGFSQNSSIDLYEDEFENNYSHENDYIETKQMDGQPVGILVADWDDKNIRVDHPYPYLPHLIGLYVVEEYRSRGVASELIHDFMDYVERDRFVADVSNEAKSFYEQLDYDIIYLREFKNYDR